MSTDIKMESLASTTNPIVHAIKKVILSLNPFPQPHNFFGYFEESGKNLIAGAATLKQMISQEHERDRLCRILEEQEHIGDRITAEVIELLHRSFLTPIDREDIHSLVTAIDDVIDNIYAIGNRLMLYQVREMPIECGQLADLIEQSVHELSKAVSHLPRLKNAKPILDCCIAVGRLENEADEKLNAVIMQLFRNGWSPYQVIQLKELLENLERTTDLCKDVAEILQGIVLKHG